jgi:diguanylate cyclase (GGDEF)-like protein
MCRLPEADHNHVKRIAFLVLGPLAVFASYMAVIFGLAPADGLGSGTLASIALPGLVSGLVVTGLIAMYTTVSHATSGQVRELQAQLAKKEVELTRLATHDDLTGLYSRHHFDETVSLEFERARRHARPFAVLLAEIDALDEFMERGGGLSRGYLLAEVAALLRTTLRINDIGCRYSDGCLAVLLPETDIDGAGVVADRIQTQLARREFFGRGKAGGATLTVSQGIAAFPESAVESHRDLQKAAEAALVEAKSAGGATIRVYAPPVAPVQADREPLAS